MAINVAGLISVIVFYLIILAVGVWAAWRQRKRGVGRTTENIMVAGRDIGIIVGSFTMTATWVGGGYINGTAESVYTASYGLLWTQAPFGYTISLVLGGIFFAKKMREQKYVTMIDPLQNKLGKRMGGILLLPAWLGELLWSAAILSALGTTLAVIIDLDVNVAVCISAAIAVLYTIVGGLYSVAYTDVIQLICIFLGLWISIPFAMTNAAVTSISGTAYSGDGGWYGVWDSNYTGTWIDFAFLLMFGGIPWQVYYQRVLAADTPRHAQMLSFVAAGGCLVMALPSVLIGAIGVSTDWNMTSYPGTTPADEGEERMILPIVLQYLTPTAVSFVGLGAVSAAVMSSADSSVLSSSTMFTRNIYRNIIRQNASETELVWVLRVAILVNAAIATVLALTIRSVYDLFVLCSDFLYVILFPQLVAVMYLDPNTYGSLCGFIIGFILRLGGGESAFKLQPFIHYPGGTNFPFRTFAMLIAFITTIVISYLAKLLFTKANLDDKYDIFKCELSYGGRGIENSEDPDDMDKGAEENPQNSNGDPKLKSYNPGVSNAAYNGETQF